MLKSGLFRNTFTLVLVALLLFAALTMGIFLPIARREFSEIYSEELTQKANYLSTHFVSYLLGLQTLDSFKARVGNNSAWRRPLSSTAPNSRSTPSPPPRATPPRPRKPPVWALLPWPKS